MKTTSRKTEQYPQSTIKQEEEGFVKPLQSLASQVFPDFCFIVPLIPTAVSFVLLYLDSREPWLDGFLLAF